ncbi:unnamed protein product [Caenorhabditis angaria]|uniref:SCP domain-containing protein n=1 Tax=Caenorhabditis angaria TaxID=860376 RepID=A0A9P1ILK2_9PELO|nr:unnamed protein product [Caenorhabditis angaria]
MTETRKYADEEETENVLRGKNEEKEKVTQISNGASYLKHILIISTAVLLTLQLSTWYSTLLSSPTKSTQKMVSTKSLVKNCGFRLSGEIQQAILDKHNEIRSKVAMGEYSLGGKNGGFLPAASSMSKMSWDCDLEAEAQDRASSCDLSKRVEIENHQDGNLRGENAFYFQTEDSDVKNAILKGISEMGQEIEKFGIGSVSDAKYDKRIGHAMQIIWESTQKVGCAIQECSLKRGGRKLFETAADSQFKVAVCKYYPTGNIFNSQKPTAIYQQGIPGENCAEAAFDPTTGLCVHEDTKISEK